MENFYFFELIVDHYFLFENFKKILRFVINNIEFQYYSEIFIGTDKFKPKFSIISSLLDKLLSLIDAQFYSDICMLLHSSKS